MTQAPTRNRPQRKRAKKRARPAQTSGEVWLREEAKERARQERGGFDRQRRDGFDRAGGG
jgi:hypothetical protein